MVVFPLGGIVRNEDEQDKYDGDLFAVTDLVTYSSYISFLTFCNWTWLSWFWQNNWANFTSWPFSQSASYADIYVFTRLYMRINYICACIFPILVVIKCSDKRKPYVHIKKRKNKWPTLILMYMWNWVWWRPLCSSRVVTGLVGLPTPASVSARTHTS